MSSASNPGGFAGLAILVKTLTLDVEHHGVTVSDDAFFDGLEARGALAQLLKRLIDGLVLDLDRRTARFDAAEVTWIEGRQHVELRLERERLSFLELEIANLRRIDWLHAAFGECVFNRVLDEMMCDVMHDLRPEALSNDFGRHFAGAESRKPRLLAIARCDARDLGVDDVGRDLDHQVFASFVDVDEFGFHGD
jgi:hypothetical protein